VLLCQVYYCLWKGGYRGITEFPLRLELSNSDLELPLGG
jgi:hypothetical protein